MLNLKNYMKAQRGIIQQYQLESLYKTDLHEFQNICELMAIFRKYFEVDGTEPVVIDVMVEVVEQELDAYNKRKLVI